MNVFPSLLLSFMLPTLGSVWLDPADSSVMPGGSLVVTVTFDPGISTIVTGLDACLDFDALVFDEPYIQQHFITDDEMTNFSFENNWPSHVDSFHYQRLRLPADDGWSVDPGAAPVYSIVFPVKSEAPLGWTTINFTPSFITFSDSTGELLDPDQIGSGSYWIGIMPTETPAPSPTATETPALVPVTNTWGSALLAAVFGIILLIRSAGRSSRNQSRI